MAIVVTVVDFAAAAVLGFARRAKAAAVAVAASGLADSVCCVRVCRHCRRCCRHRHCRHRSSSSSSGIGSGSEYFGVGDAATSAERQRRGGQAREYRPRVRARAPHDGQASADDANRYFGVAEFRVKRCSQP